MAWWSYRGHQISKTAYSFRDPRTFDRNCKAAAATTAVAGAEKVAVAVAVAIEIAVAVAVAVAVVAILGHLVAILAPCWLILEPF